MRSRVAAVGIIEVLGIHADTAVVLGAIDVRDVDRVAFAVDNRPGRFAIRTIGHVEPSLGLGDAVNGEKIVEKRAQHGRRGGLHQLVAAESEHLVAAKPNWFHPVGC